jgi:hypothetical protein
MYHKTIFHTLPGGENAKFTIRDRNIDGEVYYYANVINTDLDVYKNLSDQEKEICYGMEITNGQKRSINYRDADKLETDILNRYGYEWLETEK